MLEQGDAKPDPPKGVAAAIRAVVAGRRPQRWSRCTIAICSVTVLGALAAAIAIPLSIERWKPAPWRPRDGIHVRFPHEDAPCYDEPAYVSVDGRILEQACTDSSGTLKYKAKLIEDWERIFALDYEWRVESVECSPSTVTIKFDTAETAQAKADTLCAPDPERECSANTLITGSAEWGCTYADLYDASDTEGGAVANTTIQHRVLRLAGPVQDRQVSFKVEHVELKELFEDLEIQFESKPVADFNDTDPFPTEYDADDEAATWEPVEKTEEPPGVERSTTFDGREVIDEELEEDVPIPPPSPPTPYDGTGTEDWPDYSDNSASSQADTAAGGHGRQLFIGRVATWAEPFTRRVTGAVARIVGNVGTAARRGMDVANGNLALGSNSARRLTSWNWNGRDMRGRNGQGFDFRRSYANLNIGVLFNINLRSWKLQSAELAVDGALRVMAAVTVNARGRFSTDQKVSLVRSARLGAVTFMVGPVPINIAGSLDIDGFVRARASGQMRFSSGVGVSSNARVGIRFRNGRWTSMRNTNWNNRHLAPTLRAEETNIGVSIVPSVSLIAAWIGGPTMSFAPYIAAEMRRPPNHQTCQATLGWGMDIMVGARIDIQNPATGRAVGCRGCRHVFRSQPVHRTGTRPLWTGTC